MNVVVFRYFFIDFNSFSYYFIFHCRRNSQETWIDWWRPQSRARWECHGPLHAVKHNHLIHSNRCVLYRTTARYESVSIRKKNTRRNSTDENLWML
jgi:hypothetical protein